MIVAFSLVTAVICTFAKRTKAQLEHNVPVE